MQLKQLYSIKAIEDSFIPATINYLNAKMKNVILIYVPNKDKKKKLNMQCPTH